MVVECRLAGALHIDPVRARRAPLALVLLWLNHAAQVDGLETWWLQDGAARLSDAAVDAKIVEARAGADDWVDFEE